MTLQSKSQSYQPLNKVLKPVVTGATVAALGSTLALGLLPGVGMPSARAESIGCSSTWAQQALDYLQERLGHTPPFYFCYEIDSNETEVSYITFDEIDLSMSTNHAFVAECDSDCMDLDLKVYNSDGRVIGEDWSVDSYAEVAVSNISVGDTYRVEMTMYDCDADYCGTVLGTTPRR